MRQKGFALILIVVVLALVGVVGVYYFGTKKGGVLPRPIPTQTAQCKYKNSFSVGSEGFLDNYVVKKGDTLLSISKNVLGDVSRADELARLNHDKYPSLSTSKPFLEVGWVLNLPPEGVGRTNGLIFVETGKLSIGDEGWGTGYPQKSQRYDLIDLDKAMFGQNIKEGECVIILYEGNDVSGVASGIRALKIIRQ